jgi:LCP family protein required for cell wall assembly
VLAGIAICATVLMVGVSLFAYAAYRNVYDSIRHDNVTAAMLGKRPPKLNGALNVLVIGSDSRKGSHGHYGRGIYGSRSDTAMMLHISPTHQHAVVISFPRDSVIPILKCLPDGHGHSGQQAAPGQTEMLNSSFAYGGAPCLWKTLEQTTGIRIDHFVEVNFSGFRSIVNDVGGVSVCLPFPIKDPASGLNLHSGRQNVNGAQALAFVRERHVGLGSDLQRIQRQQYFLAAAMQKIKQTNLLSNPARIYAVIRDVARSLTTDSSLTLSTMAGIANGMKGLSASSLQFVSLPVVPDPSDPNRVEWSQPQDSELFRAVAHDTTLPKTHKGGGHGKPATPARTVSPSQIHVDVQNGSGTSGLAGTTATSLTNLGFRVVGQGDAANFNFASTVIEYGSPSQLPAVNTLKKQLGNAQVQQVPAVQPGTLNLILGSDFSGLSSGKAKSGSGASVSNLSKTYGGINGSTNICKDSSAFAGPDNPTMFAP